MRGAVAASENPTPRIIAVVPPAAPASPAKPINAAGPGLGTPALLLEDAGTPAGPRVPESVTGAGSSGRFGVDGGGIVALDRALDRLVEAVGADRRGDACEFELVPHPVS